MVMRVAQSPKDKIADHANEQDGKGGVYFGHRLLLGCLRHDCPFGETKNGRIVTRDGDFCVINVKICLQNGGA